MEFTYSNSIADKAENMDLLNLFATLSANQKIKSAKLSRVYLREIHYSDSVNSNHVVVTAVLQGWQHGESGTGRQFHWICDRAKTFSCMNISIFEVRTA